MDSDVCTLFVSYAHATPNRLEVFRYIVDHIESTANKQCHVVTDADILPGTYWRGEIIRYIQRCDVFCVLVPHDISTEIVLECGVAVGARKPILAMVDNEDVAALATYGLEHLQAIVWKNNLPEDLKIPFVNDVIVQVARVIYSTKGWKLSKDGN
jgi:hypothetical protein